MEKIIIYTDGGARGNPGPAGIGALITNEREEILKEISQYIGERTNNFAEYEALIHALRAAHAMLKNKIDAVEIEVRMDSELVVRQIAGRYKVKEPTLKEQFAKVGELLAAFPRITFTHVRREKNKHADLLVNKAIDAAQK